MMCGHCVKAVKMALDDIDGVTGTEVILEDNAAIVTFDDALTGLESFTEAIIEDSKRYKELLASRVPVTKTRKTVTVPREWECLVTEIETKKSKQSLGKVPLEQATKWRLKVVENLSERRRRAGAPGSGAGRRS